MESTEELQQNEITALKSIYGEDYIEGPPPKAWKGASRLPVFFIRVAHPNPEYAKKIHFKLHITFPKTYPTLQPLIYQVQEPVGLAKNDLAKLSAVQQQVVKATKGSETVMELVTACQDWLDQHTKPPVEAPGSLAFQMNQRAEDEEKARKLKAQEEAIREKEKAAKLAEELRLEEDAQRKSLAKERRTRRRAPSDATTVVGDTLTEHFNEDIEMNGVTFNSVKYYHPRKDCLGTTYAADPICDDVSASLPLQLHVVTFDTPYYASSQGKKKIRQVESEIRRLTTIKHENIVRTLAVKLTQKTGNLSQLFILSEQPPALTLQDILEDSESLREERASDYLGQLLSGLNAIHANDMVHRGITARVIGLAPRELPALTSSKRIKLFKVAFFTRLLDLHKSDPFRSDLAISDDDTPLPDAWLSEDVKESALLYTRSRDIHAVGIVFLQMLSGLDVVRRFSDVHAAITSSNISPSLQRHTLNMILPNKRKHATCLSLLADLSSLSISTRTPVRSPVIPAPGPKTPTAANIGTSPEIEYFKPAIARAARQSSRWKEDWEELELLGKGAFGSVVKARNIIDGRIYAVKKVRLKTMKSDSRIFREVNALSRLSHRFIVRYYTTWVETSEQHRSLHSDSEDTDTDFTSEEPTTDGRTSVPSRELTTSLDDGMVFDLNDLDDPSSSRGSFPSIHFGRSADSGAEDTDPESGSDSTGLDLALEGLFRPSSRTDVISNPHPSPVPLINRTLYIQMEFVERQTLKERIDEGLTQQEAWRLFQQIVDALAYMSTLGIIHRDIKLTNIFIDGNGDCKVGDFGLATSSLAAVDPSDVSPRVTVPNADMTFDVGTRLYIAPEVQNRKRGATDHSKADMYSLGIVFFEMNFMFSTGSERIVVLENLRKPEIAFPASWKPTLSRQRQIITWLLQHDPDERPTAIELSQSSLLPPRLEDEYFKGALRLMTKPDSPHYQAVLSSLFSQPLRQARGFLYDSHMPEILPLYQVVIERLASLFRLRGAVDAEPPLLLPSTSESVKDHVLATFIDRHGDVVNLSDNLIVPFARLAARLGTKRIKRFHIGDIYRSMSVTGHPKSRKVAVFDIITPDLSAGPVSSTAEMLAVASDLLQNFPGLEQNYTMHISHCNIMDEVFARIPEDKRNATFDILQQHKSSSSQWKAELLKRQLPRSLVDELEILIDKDEEIDSLMSRLEKASPTSATKIQAAVEEIKATIEHARYLGVNRRIFFRPLLLETYKQNLHKYGVVFEVVKKSKRNDVMAIGGRYDHLISRFSAPKVQTEPNIFASAIQISVDKVVWALDSYQSARYQSLITEKLSFGFWSSRRCDVYVVSYSEGYLQDRLEMVAHLWQHGISADLMYESSVQSSNPQEIHDQCLREGILFIVYPRPRPLKPNQTAYMVKSVLRGTEYDVSKQDLVSWLQQQIVDQKRNDLSTAEAPLFTNGGEINLAPSNPQLSDIQAVLPQDLKKQRKHVRHLLMERTYDTVAELKSSLIRHSNTPGAGIPAIAIDVSPTLFDALIRSANWVTDEDAFKALQGEFMNTSYGQQVKEAVARKKSDGYSWILFFAVKEERIGLLRLQ